MQEQLNHIVDRFFASIHNTALVVHVAKYYLATLFSEHVSNAVITRFD